MKKTLLVTLDFYPSVGGIANYWKHFGACMSAEKWIVLAPPLPAGVQEIDAPYNIVRKIFFSSFLYPRWLLLFFQILFFVKKEKIDAMVAGQILPVGTAVWLVSRMLSIPYSISLHGMDIGLAGRHWRKKRVCKKILSHASCVIVNSAYTALLAREIGVPEKKIEIVYPCPSITPALLDEHAVIPREFHAKKIILSVGRLVARKGFDYLIRALPAVFEKEPDAVCVILGNGPMAAELEKIVRDLNLWDRVFFVRNADDTKLATWYAGCSVFCMASYELDGDVEGFGIVYLDANSFGKPVIGTRSGGIPEAVIDGKTGVLVAQKNSTEIAQAIIRLLSDTPLAQRLGDQGQKRAVEDFQWCVQAEKLKKILI